MHTKRSLFCLASALCTVLACVCVLAGCSKKESPEVATGTQWSLSQNVTARIEDNGNHGYVLVVDGTGALPDFEAANAAPWYPVSGRISDIIIADGITSIGQNAFSACTHVKTAVLPKSVTKIGSGAFDRSVKVCAYTKPDADCNIWLYSENKPEYGGYYWHYENNEVRIWDVVKVLFIGNSFTYTNDIDLIFNELANRAGVSVMTQRIAIGAHNVSQFADPEDEGGALVEQYLTSCDDYDFVVVQDQSVRPLTNYDQFADGMAKLRKRVAETQNSCQFVLYATWGYPKEAESKKQTVPQMESQLRAAYQSVADMLGVEVSPVGEAFTKVYTEHPEINLYLSDGQHPSYAGAYLAACIHLGALLEVDPRTSTFDGLSVEIDSKTSEILKESSYYVVF